LRVGLDINSLKAHVDWETFLKLYCIFEVGNIEQSKLITFWCKFFDTDMLGICLKADYEDLLEHDWNPMRDLQAMDRAHRIG